MKTKFVVEVNQKFMCHMCDEIFPAIVMKDVKGKKVCCPCYMNVMEFEE